MSRVRGLVATQNIRDRDGRFIGFHFSKRMLGEGFVVLGYYGKTDYCNAALKRRWYHMVLVGAVEAMLER